MGFFILWIPFAFAQQAASPAGEDMPELPPQPQLPPILQNPAVQKYAQKMLALMQDPKFQEHSLRIVQHPQIKWFYAAVGAAIILLMIVRHRVLSGITRLWLRLLVRLVFALTFPFAIIAVAYLFFGPSLVYILERTKEAFL